ncbi:MAG: YbfB/YjiJ family MFS transporter [Pseudomonadota bacterium]
MTVNAEIEGRHAVLVALGGFLALLGAMGIGRFLFTPALPMMPGLGPAEAGLVASANFAGYLIGALMGALPAFGARAGGVLAISLGLSAVTTGAMALLEAPMAWAALRFLGGLASAWVLVTSSALVSARLAAAGRPGLSALHFAGVGAGITLSAILASPFILPDDGWQHLWLMGAGVTLLAGLGTLALVPLHQAAPAAGGAATSSGEGGLWRLVVSYGGVGFGYVITATFIVAILREDGGSRADEALVWGLVGLAGMPSILAWRIVAGRIGVVPVLQAAMLVEAVGIAAGALLGGTLALAVAALCLGATFMALTAIGLQEAVRRAPGNAQGVIALMTAAFGLGQIIGPALAGWLRAETGSFTAPSLMAAAVLLAGAALLFPLRRRSDGSG